MKKRKIGFSNFVRADGRAGITLAPLPATILPPGVPDVPVIVTTVTSTPVDSSIFTPSLPPAPITTATDLNPPPPPPPDSSTISAPASATLPNATGTTGTGLNNVMPVVVPVSTILGINKIYFLAGVGILILGIGAIIIFKEQK